MAPLYWQGTLEAAEVGRSRGRKGQKGAERVERVERGGQGRKGKEGWCEYFGGGKKE